MLLAPKLRPLYDDRRSIVTCDPASSPYTIGVSGTAGAADSDRKAFFSQWGEEIDVAAPSIDIYSLLLDGEYGLNLGTSFATPFVAGLSALILSGDDTLSNEEVRDAIRSTARDLPDEGRPNWDGAGLIDVGAALGVPSPFATVNLTAPDPSALLLFLIVGNESAPSCRVEVWDGSYAGSSSVSGSFAVGGCEDYWPPNDGQPWRLIASHTGGKAPRIHSLGLAMNGVACGFEGLPAIVFGTERSVAYSNCGSPGLKGDSPEDAMVIPADRLPRSLENDGLYATNVDEPPISCAASYSQSLWYKIPATGEETTLAADTFGSGFDTVIAVFSGVPGSLDEIACNDDYGPPQSRIVWQADDASDYYLMAAAFDQIRAGQIKVNISKTVLPANDDPDAAALLGVGETVLMPAHSATTSLDDPGPSCVSAQGHTMWFEITPAVSSSLVLDTAGSSYDTVLGVYDNGGDNGGALEEVACNDDVGPGIRTSVVEWEAEAGRTYFALVASFADRPSGALRLTLTEDGGP